MSTTIPTLLSPTLSFKPSIPSTQFQRFRPQFRRKAIGFSAKTPTFPLGRVFALSDKDSNGDVLNGLDEAEKEARGNSTMPDRFRYLTKEVPSPPVRWPWLVGQFHYPLPLSLYKGKQKLNKFNFFYFQLNNCVNGCFFFKKNKYEE